MQIRNDNVNGFEGLTEMEYEQMTKMFKSNGIAIRMTAYHGDTKTYDIQFENPYQIYSKHFGNISASQIDEYARESMENYYR